jgi:SAM-dependent methyltransferase
MQQAKRRRQRFQTFLCESTAANDVDQIIDALEALYPTAGLDQRIALSRKDGYWPFIQKGEDPPQEFVYGEFDLTFFSQVLEQAATYSNNGTGDANRNFGSETSTQSPWKGKVFTDIGSGTGRLVLAAAALHPWKVCRGVELLEGIHAGAVETLQKCCQERFASSGADVPKEMSSSSAMLSMSNDNISIPLAPVELKCGSFDDPYEFFGDSDLIFVFSSCMNTHILINLAQSIGRQCKPGCLVLTTEYHLPLGGNVGPLTDDPDYPSGEYALELLESITGTNEATGGESTVHIHRVTKALGTGIPRERPKLSVSEICYRAIKEAEDPSKNDPRDFLRCVSNQMAFIGLPDSWRPTLPQ